MRASRAFNNISSRSQDCQKPRRDVQRRTSSSPTKHPKDSTMAPFKYHHTLILLVLCRAAWQGRAFESTSIDSSVLGEDDPVLLLRNDHKERASNPRSDHNVSQMERIYDQEHRGEAHSSDSSDSSDDGQQKPNLLFIIADQLRFDTLGFIQQRMDAYVGKLKVHTPNLDSLARKGAYFETAYCMSPSCGPSRTTLRTGNTIQRTGISGNKLVKERFYSVMNMFKKRVEKIVGYEQLLVEELNYVAEAYGKWHTPERLFRTRDGSDFVISANDFDFSTNKPSFEASQQFKPFYQRALNYLIAKDKVQMNLDKGSTYQRNFLSGWPYRPIKLDARYKRASDTPLTKRAGFDNFEKGEANICGRDELPSDYSTSAIIGKMAVKAINRLAKTGKPFALTASFLSPHPPMVTPKEYFNMYWSRRKEIFVTPSYKDPMKNTVYGRENGREQLLQAGYGYDERKSLQEMIAAYYGLVTELDHWVGQLLEALERNGLTDNTLVVFTSDHGELLGAHSMRGKSILYEEATRVPLIIAFPNKIHAGRVVHEPVSHLDVFATIMDYLNAEHLDHSDGRSLRRFIERKAENKFYDEAVAVVETEKRVPQSPNALTKELGQDPNFMVRKGDWKLIITKKAKAPIIDMMYNTRRDPYEIHNLLGTNAMRASRLVIGKAEHLKCLLVEWMKRQNGNQNFYSDNRWNRGEGRGDITEVKHRRTWPMVNFWQSDHTLEFARASRYGDVFFRHEYLYIGRTTPGVLRITRASIKGEDRHKFRIWPTRAIIQKDGYVRFKVTYRSEERLQGINAYIEIRVAGMGVKKIPMRYNGE